VRGMNGEEVERKRDRERVKRVTHGWYMGGGIQLIVGKLLTSDWNAPIAPHFVQCKFTSNANHLARFSFSFGRENLNWETNVVLYQR